MASSNAAEGSQAPGEAVKFGKWNIDPREIFAETPFSVGIVNHKPIVPGHVLVISRRVVPRYADLRPEEVADLWITSQRVGRILESAFGASSLTFAIQDGEDAGQTVLHVHVHVLPRQKGDFRKNDQIYDEIEKNEKDINRETVRMDAEEERKPRSMEDMEREALKLRALIEEDLALKDILGGFVRASSVR